MSGPATGQPPRSSPERRRVAYVMSRFPKLTETFILRELDAVERLGVEVHLFPLIHQRERVVHPEAVPWVERAHYLPVLSPAIVRSHGWLLLRRPRAYLGALWAVVSGTWGSLNLFVGGLGIFPKVAHAARLMERAGVEHVHCHFATHPALAGFVVHRLTGIPFSFTAHGSDLHVDRHMLPQKVAEAAFVVAISEENRRVILAECGPGAADTVHVVRCGVDLSVFRPRPRPRAPSAAEGTGLAVVCVGSLHEVKGQRHLVEACRLAREEGHRLHCTLVGDGPDRRALQDEVTAAGLDDVVTFAGRRTGREVVELLGQADVLVAPSVPTARGKREGIPVVLMEAMACGLPVVASDLSGIPELVEHERSGLLVPPGDARALAAALGRLADDPTLRENLGRAGRSRVEEAFDLHANAARLVALLAKSADG